MRTTIAAALCLLGIACLAGCSLLVTQQSIQRSTPFGVVVLTDHATCKRVEVQEQQVNRDREGRLVVKVHWLNVSEKPYKAQVRVAFQDIEGALERGAYDWDIQQFHPGEQTVEWTSYTPDAVRYRIELKKAR